MRINELKPNQRLMLLALMAAGGAAPNQHLSSVVALKAPDRKALERHGLVLATPLPRGSFALELTDAGWNTARETFTAAPPPGSRSADKVLHAVLGRLAGFMETNLLSAADVFAVMPSPAPAPAGGESRPSAARAIEEAYRALVTRPQGWVRLSALRRALPDFDRDALDAALLDLLRARRISLEPVVDQKTLTAEDRAAGLLVGAAPAHHFAFLD